MTGAASRAWRAEARALLALQAVEGIGDARLGRLLETFGSGEAAMAARVSRFDACLGKRLAGRRRDGEVLRAVDAGLDWCESEGVAVVPRGAETYPDRLLDLDDPPAVLFLRGEADLLERPTLAVVGSRRSTEYGRRVSHDVGAAAASAGIVVASGLALGIDAAAHEGALAVGGPTTAVLGCGPDRAYPRRHTGLFRRIEERGLLVSEFLPGVAPLPHHFPRRNRIIAALSAAVVVVEAASRSGALITADHALDLGRDVAAVPGPIDRETSAGTNELLRLGAHVLTAPERAVELVLGVGHPRQRAPAPVAVEGRLFESLETTPAHLDDLARRAGLTASEALQELSLLELSGRVRREAGLRFRRLR